MNYLFSSIVVLFLLWPFPFLCCVVSCGSQLTVLVQLWSKIKSSKYRLKQFIRSHQISVAYMYSFGIILVSWDHPAIPNCNYSMSYRSWTHLVQSENGKLVADSYNIMSAVESCQTQESIFNLTRLLVSKHLWNTSNKYVKSPQNAWTFIFNKIQVLFEHIKNINRRVFFHKAQKKLTLLNAEFDWGDWCV
jgi:hypothetical protein